MSLESDIQALTKAVVKLTEVLQKQFSESDSHDNLVVEVAPEAAKAPVLPANVPDLPLPSPHAEPPERTSKVTQADLREVAQKLLAQKKLPEILRINKEHGIKRITECPEEKYDAVYASLTAALGDVS